MAPPSCTTAATLAGPRPEAGPPPADDRRPIDPRIVNEASGWLVRLWSGEAGPEDEAACQRWRAADPEHERAWQRFQSLGARMLGVDAGLARRVLLPGATAPARRRVLRALGAAVLLGGVVHNVRESGWWQQQACDVATLLGQRRELVLADGSRLLLDGDSAVDIRFDGDWRRIVLRRGRILVTSAPDPAARYRPLVVDSAQGRVRALGTRFSVQQEAERSRVAVYEGAVELQPRHRGSLRLERGQQGSFSLLQASLDGPSRESDLAWREGRLVAEQMRLADFLAELGRHRRGVLRCDPRVAELRLTGVFPLDDTDLALAAVTQGLPVQLHFVTRYWVTVQPR